MRTRASHAEGLAPRPGGPSRFRGRLEGPSVPARQARGAAGVRRRAAGGRSRSRARGDTGATRRVPAAPHVRAADVPASAPRAPRGLLRTSWSYSQDCARAWPEPRARRRACRSSEVPRHDLRVLARPRPARPRLGAVEPVRAAGRRPPARRAPTPANGRPGAPISTTLREAPRRDQLPDPFPRRHRRRPTRSTRPRPLRRPSGGFGRDTSTAGRATTSYSGSAATASPAARPHDPRGRRHRIVARAGDDAVYADSARQARRR